MLDPRGPSGAGAVTAHWPRLAFAGVLDVLIGVMALAWPGVTVLALALILGLILLVSGVFSIAFGLRLRSTRGGGVWPILVGVFSLLAAVICLIHPGAGVAAIAFGAAIWFLLTGASDISRAINLSTDRLWWGFLGILSLIAGLVLLVDLGAAILTIALVVGFAFLMRGAAELSVAFRLRKLHAR